MRHLRGMVLVGLGRACEALAAFDEALRLDPGAVPVACGRAMALADLGRFDEALAEVDRAAEINPNDANIEKIRSALAERAGGGREAAGE